VYNSSASTGHATTQLLQPVQRSMLTCTANAIFYHAPASRSIKKSTKKEWLTDIHKLF
jgi:hypothetical protein